MTDGIIVELSELIDIRRFSPSLDYPARAKSKQFGNYVSPIRGRGMDFSEVRNYQAGDEIRHMEWRVTARTGRPHVKLYQEERERPIILLVDLNPSMIFGTRIALKSVVAARLSALIAWTAVKRGDRVGGLVVSATKHHEFSPKSRENGILPMLAAISHLTKQPANETAPSFPMMESLLRLRRVVKPGSTIMIISDFYTMDASCDMHLRRLSNNNDLLFYHVCDPLELAAPMPGQYPVTDGKNELILNTQSRQIRENYTHYCEKRIHTLKDQCRKLQARYIRVTAGDDLTEVIYHSIPGRQYGRP